MNTTLSEEEIQLLLQKKDELSPELIQLLEEYENLKSSEQPFDMGENCGITFSFNHRIFLLPSVVISYPSQNDITVIILTPLTKETLPCHQFLAGHCQDPCPLGHSHGYMLPREYAVPYNALDLDNLPEQLQSDASVWYKDKESMLWKEARVVEQISETSWKVRNSARQEFIVELGDIIPIRELGSLEESEHKVQDKEESDVIDYEMTERAPNTWGGWQAHTTDFAARMMKKMGYQEGKGLGLQGQGRVEFVQETKYGQTGRPGLGFEKQKPKKKTKPKMIAKEKNDVFSYMNSILEPVKKSTKVPEGSAPKPTNEKEAYKAIAKLQDEMNKAQLGLSNAKAAYKRNKGTFNEDLFSTKLKDAAAHLDVVTTELKKLQRHVKQTKEKQDMYTF
ncbi:hypothetical protein CU097_008083 [Rhizopus azygosporus]|uniref:G-patch domain-containing protein n=1 Tax=Rhizopus azygosporus TaxID=86630 RepID=A0A367JCI2_RHIAZ|nr:hypothetical protein CU097_008083 [Rhizopus azygosporus]